MSGPSPIDTAESAPSPEEARLGPVYLWVLLLAGPLIWGVHFLLVYLLTEAVCGIEGLRFGLLGMPGVSVIVTALTIVAMVAVAWFGYRAWREWRTGKEGDEGVPRFVGLSGLLLSLLFLVAVAFVGLPALALSPC